MKLVPYKLQEAPEIPSPFHHVKMQGSVYAQMGASTQPCQQPDRGLAGSRTEK